MNISKLFIKLLAAALSLLPYLKPLYGFIKAPVKSYSQKGEDLLVDVYFNRRRFGYYLDIGCYHPKWTSNTHIFYKKGWIGTVVDIDLYKLKWFKRFRRGKVNIVHSAVVDTPIGIGEANAYKFFKKSGWSLVDTLDEKTAQSNRAKGWGEFTIEKINTIDINTLLDSLPPVDFLSVDIEGMDTKIINKINFSKHKIPLILFEDNYFFSDSNRLKAKLEDNGYAHLFTTGGSICYVLKGNL